MKAPKEQLREQASKKAEALTAQGKTVLVVYDDAEHARVYEENRTYKS